MALGGRVALAGVEQIGATAGLRAGFGPLRVLVRELNDPADRLRAIRLGFEWGLELGDEPALLELCDAWIGQQGTDIAGLVELVSWLAHRGRLDLVLRLAEAQCVRAPGDPRTWYLCARIELDLKPDPSQPEARKHLRRALRHAKERSVDAGCIRRRLAQLGEAFGGAGGAGDTEDSAAQLASLVLLLSAKGRYKRTRALDGLNELAQHEDAQVAREAMRAVARHVDREPRLTEIELDRAQTVLSHWPDLAARQEALGRVAARLRISRGEAAASGDAPPTASTRAIDLARSVLEHGVAGSAVSAGARTPTLQWRAQDAIAKLRRGTSTASTRDAYQSLLSAADTGGVLSVAIVTATWLGCRADDETVRRTAQLLASRLLTLSGDPPSRGWARVAAVVDDPALAPALLEKGMAAGDPEARVALADAITREAWRVHAAGESAKALALLQRAKHLHA